MESYHTQVNLKKLGASYGALHKQGRYFLVYEAPARHYIARDRAAFENIKDSFKLLD